MNKRHSILFLVKCFVLTRVMNLYSMTGLNNAIIIPIGGNSFLKAAVFLSAEADYNGGLKNLWIQGQK